MGSQNRLEPAGQWGRKGGQEKMDEGMENLGGREKDIWNGIVHRRKNETPMGNDIDLGGEETGERR